MRFPQPPQDRAADGLWTVREGPGEGLETRLKPAAVPKRFPQFKWLQGKG